MTEKNTIENNSNIDALVSAIIAEYTSMREHMAQYQNERNSYVNYSLLLILAVFSAVGTPIYNKFPSILLLVPFVFFVLGMMHLDRTLRIKRSADYLHNFIRPLLTRKLGQDVLAYDEYKANFGNVLFHDALTIYMSGKGFRTDK